MTGTEDFGRWLEERLSILSRLPAWGALRLEWLRPRSRPARWRVDLQGSATSVRPSADAEPVRCLVRICEEEFWDYVAGRRLLLDLLSTGRLTLTGNHRLGLVLLYALKTGETDPTWPLPWQMLGRDALTPFPGVSIRQDFDVEPAVPEHPCSFPIVINSFNRPTPLAALVESLQRRGYHNLYVIDNASRYGPLFDFYRRSKLRVYYLDANVGAFAFWRTAIERDFLQGYYCYTDADVVPVEQCPQDFMSHFLGLLDRYPHWDKVGFGLKIDDLPDCFAHKQQVIRHETPFWKGPICDDVYLAAIDTTFALYRPGARGGTILTAARTGGSYVARHLPWYADSARPTPEEQFYLEHVTSYAHWSNLDRLKLAPLPPHPTELPLARGAGEAED